MSAEPVAPVALVALPGGRESDPELERILDRLDNLLGRYIAWPSPEARWSVAAWAVHCWVVQAFDTTPRLSVLSPEKGSGKTRVLEVLQLVTPGAELVLNISPAALFRMIDAGPITLLMDEADTYLGTKVAKEHEDLRGLVNAGYRRGATVPRVNMKAKPGQQIQRFPAFAPVALAGIGDLPDTIIDRSVIIAMKKRAPDEPVEPFRQRRGEAETLDLKDWLQAWSDANVERLEDYEPVLPDGIVDRPADVWEPLIIIGDWSGAEWSARIRSAAVMLNRQRQERDPSLGIRLLADCRDIFAGTDADRMTTELLLDRLTNIDDAPWGDLRGKPLDSRGLARRLRKYEVRPGDHRFPAGTRKGYLAEEFYDAWQRYLPPMLPLGGQPPKPEHFRNDSQNGGGGDDRTLSPVEGQQGQQAQQPAEVIDTGDYESRHPDLFGAES